MLINSLKTPSTRKRIIALLSSGSMCMSLALFSTLWAMISSKSFDTAVLSCEFCEFSSSNLSSLMRVVIFSFNSNSLKSPKIWCLLARTALMNLCLKNSCALSKICLSHSLPKAMKTNSSSSLKGRAQCVLSHIKGICL